MDEEFKTIKFPDSEMGQTEKIKAMTEGAAQGWRVISETITSETIDAGKTAKDAACMCFLCGPFCTPFLMKPTVNKGTITVTFARSAEDRQALETTNAERRKKELEQQDIRAEKLKKDRELADLDRLLTDYQNEYPDKYLSETITKVVSFYLKNDRVPFSPVPRLVDCCRINGEILVRGAGELLLRKYTVVEVKKIIDNNH
jgi:hypothetical protein